MHKLCRNALRQAHYQRTCTNKTAYQTGHDIVSLAKAHQGGLTGTALQQPRRSLPAAPAYLRSTSRHPGAACPRWPRDRQRRLARNCAALAAACQMAAAHCQVPARLQMQRAPLSAGYHTLTHRAALHRYVRVS